MKICISLLLLVFTLVSKAQDNTIYVLKQSAAINSYDIKVPDLLTGKEVIAQKGWKFVVDHDLKNGSVIHFLKWKENETRNENFYAEITTKQENSFWSKEPKLVEEEGEKKYFYISKIKFTEIAEEAQKIQPKWSLFTGALTIPIKIRPAGNKNDEDGNKLRPFDFTGEVNVGLSAGLRWKVPKTKDRLYLIPTTGLNLTSISIDESTVKNQVVTSKTNASSLSPFVGGIIEYDNFQILLMTGWDFIAGKTGENWIYQGKPWYGLGIGYNIFNTKGGKPKNSD